MKASEEAALRRALAVIGRRGGKAGTGAAKKRSHEHYVAAGRARWAKAKGKGKIVGVRR
jgi:hypothetical protein